MSENDPWTKKSWQRPWSTQEMIDNAANWSLAGDAGLLLHLQKISDDIIIRSKQTLDNIDSLFESLTDTEVGLSNVTNHFMGLHHTQFVESRVYDEDETEVCAQENNKKENDVKKTVPEDSLEAMKRVVEKGLRLLDTHFEKIEVSDSDTEDESEGSSFIIQPRDPYINRPLPHVIGTPEWFANPYFGLQNSDSDETLSGESTPKQKNEHKLSARLSVTDSLSNSDSDFDTISTNKQIDSQQAQTMQTIEPTGDIFGSSSESDTDLTKTSANANAVFAAELAKKLGSVSTDPMNYMIKGDDDVYGKPNKNSNTSRPSQTIHKSMEPDLFADEPPPLDNFGMPSSNSENLFDDNEDDLFWDTAGNISTAKQQGQTNSDVKVSTNKGLKTDEDDNDILIENKKDVEPKSEIKKSEPIRTNQFKSKGLFDDEDDDMDDLFSSASKLHKNEPKEYLSKNNGKMIVPLVNDQPPPLEELETKKKKLPGAVLMIGGVDSLFNENVAKLLKTRKHSSSDSENGNSGQTISKLDITTTNLPKVSEIQSEDTNVNKMIKTPKTVPNNEVTKSILKKKVISLFDDDDDETDDFDCLGQKKATLFDNTMPNLVKDNLPEINTKGIQKKNSIFDDLLPSTSKTETDSTKVDIFSDTFENEDIFSSLKPKNTLKDTSENIVALKSDDHKEFKKYSSNIFDDMSDDDLFSALTVNKQKDSEDNVINNDIGNENTLIKNVNLNIKHNKNINIFDNNSNNEDIFSTLSINTNQLDKNNLDSKISKVQNKKDIFESDIVNTDSSNKTIASRDHVNRNVLETNANPSVPAQVNSKLNIFTENIDDELFSNVDDDFTDQNPTTDCFRDIEQSYKSHTYSIFDNEPPDLDITDKNEDAKSETDSTDLFDAVPSSEYLESKYTTLFEDTPPPLNITTHEISKNLTMPEDVLFESKSSISRIQTKSSVSDNVVVEPKSNIKRASESLFSESEYLFGNRDSKDSVFQPVDDRNDLSSSLFCDRKDIFDNSDLTDTLFKSSNIESDHSVVKTLVEHVNTVDKTFKQINTDNLLRGNSDIIVSVVDNTLYDKTQDKNGDVQESGLQQSTPISNIICNENMTEKEQVDGGIISTGKNLPDSPGKLKHSLRIDVTALLPGAKPNKPSTDKTNSNNVSSIEKVETLESSAHKVTVGSSSKLKKNNSIDVSTLLPDVKLNKRKIEEPSSFSAPALEQIETLQSLVHKERVRIPVKRKPSTRRARKEAIRNSLIEVDSVDAQLLGPEIVNETENYEDKQKDNNFSDTKELSSKPTEIVMETNETIDKSKLRKKDTITKIEIIKENKFPIFSDDKAEQSVPNDENIFKQSFDVEGQTNIRSKNIDSTGVINKTEIISDSLRSLPQKIDSEIIINKESIQRKDVKTKSLIFTEDSDDDLFSALPTKSNPNELIRNTNKIENVESTKNMLLINKKETSNLLKTVERQGEDNLLFKKDDLFNVKSKLDSENKLPINKIETHTSSSIFSDEDDDDLFGGGIIKKPIVKSALMTDDNSKISATVIEKPNSRSSIFSDEEDDLFGGSKSRASSKPATSLFDNKSLKSKNVKKDSSTLSSIKKTSLFDDGDNDDLFAASSSKGKKHSMIDSNISSGTKPIKSNVKPAFDDPLLSNLNEDE